MKTFSTLKHSSQSTCKNHFNRYSNGICFSVGNLSKWNSTFMLEFLCAWGKSERKSNAAIEYSVCNSVGKWLHEFFITFFFWIHQTQIPQIIFRFYRFYLKIIWLHVTLGLAFSEAIFRYLQIEYENYRLICHRQRHHFPEDLSTEKTTRQSINVWTYGHFRSFDQIIATQDVAFQIDFNSRNPPTVRTSCERLNVDQSSRIELEASQFTFAQMNRNNWLRNDEEYEKKRRHSHVNFYNVRHRPQNSQWLRKQMPTKSIANTKMTGKNYGNITVWCLMWTKWFYSILFSII